MFERILNTPLDKVELAMKNKDVLLLSTATAALLIAIVC